MKKIEDLVFWGILYVALKISLLSLEVQGKGDDNWTFAVWGFSILCGIIFTYNALFRKYK